MKPEASDILNIGAEQLMGLIPSLSASYQQGAVAVQALLIKFAAREYERGAEIRVAENADIRALLAELAPEVALPKDTSLAISALDAVNAQLRRLLIETHARADAAANKRIWRLLKDMAARRAVPLF
jgi:inosine/xanthosine triphosphate pyrophosphatase family protein